MLIIDKEMPVMIDVDETLIMDFHDEKETKGIFIPDVDGSMALRVPHKKHIKLLKDFKRRGYTIVIWSGNGWEWAASVVKALDLEKHVDLVMSKPVKYVDDLQAVEILGPRIYLKD